MILIIEKILRMTRRLLGALVVPALLLAACGSTSDQGDGGIAVVATTSILGDIASGVIGDEGTVEVLIPLGADSHEFQPSAQQAAILAGADLVVANGLGLEEGLVDLLTSTEADGVPVIELAPLVDPIPFAAHGEQEEEHEDEDQSEEAHEHGDEDPHFWMDPIRVGAAAEALADEMTVIGLEGSWQQRAGAYADAMTETDARIGSLFESIPAERRNMVTNHEAFGYLADRYGFEIIGVVIPGGSTLAEPSSAELAALVEVMMEHDVNVIFAETTQPTTLAEAVAAELGGDVKVVELHTESLGEPGSPADTLQGMLLTNADLIADALS
jgi:zinc/manganese transport system substrate-binding protein